MSNMNMASTCLLLVAFAYPILASDPLDLACYCDLPDCKDNSFCKSSLGCFTELPRSMLSTEPARHGCLETFAEDVLYACIRSARQRSTTSGMQMTYLDCCYGDMCNYVPPSDMSLGSWIDPQYQPQQPTHVQQRTPAQSSVWFHAALIAIPAVGLIILFVLIALGCWLLRVPVHQGEFTKLGEEAAEVQQTVCNVSEQHER